MDYLYIKSDCVLLVGKRIPIKKYNGIMIGESWVTIAFERLVVVYYISIVYIVCIIILYVRRPRAVSEFYAHSIKYNIMAIIIQ